ncbi:hypothetical protein A5844_002687 [Enterococcus sp. 10A9_DIV0425]|uniref:Uncharacterized protein n=1 Tax=Candidatus Enterococcus wittei TaxID=1987383 RepID=A0A242JVZ7_9ENTE|nr:hypothetical protein [Enterococcus sp. 10A9_DIV0425]OTP06981.1 hypothetical protein A5844_002687 [Enterococcus sp. 10A9_DIV0425]THE12670.1 hypothetical protein E1H99_07000 [Enterococcus hirae]
MSGIALLYFVVKALWLLAKLIVKIVKIPFKLGKWISNRVEEKRKRDFNKQLREEKLKGLKQKNAVRSQQLQSNQSLTRQSTTSQPALISLASGAMEKSQLETNVSMKANQSLNLGIVRG